MRRGREAFVARRGLSDGEEGSHGGEIACQRLRDRPALFGRDMQNISFAAEQPRVRDQGRGFVIRAARAGRVRGLWLGLIQDITPPYLKINFFLFHLKVG